MGKIAQKTLMAQTSSPSLAPSDERLSLIFSTMEIQVSNGMKQACEDYAQSVIVSKQVETFNNPHFGEIRTAVDDFGEPWFCLADICKALDLTAKGVRQRLDDGVISNYPITDALGREQQAIFVNEDGLYDAILDSRKPEARAYRKWITGEVLPSIRKTGGYSVPGRTTSNPQLQFVQTQIYLAETISRNLRLNEASRLGMYQSIAEPYHLAIPQYVESKGVTKALKDLLADMHSPYSAIKFNQMLEAQGYIETKTRPSSGGSVKRFKSITDKGLAYGENMQNPRNQKETQPHWYADRFNELYNIITA